MPYRGDFHLRGNIFLPKSQAPAATSSLSSSRPCIIDWGQCKRGLGACDLAYLLTLCVNEQDRIKRDTHLLKRYHQRLQAAGIMAVSFPQCLWDYRFSILTNVFTSLFQGSLRWFRKSMPIVKAWQCADLLE